MLVKYLLQRKKYLIIESNKNITMKGLFCFDNDKDQSSKLLSFILVTYLKNIFFLLYNS
jgi:hypothetical protein